MAVCTRVGAWWVFTDTSSPLVNSPCDWKQAVGRSLKNKQPFIGERIHLLPAVNCKVRVDLIGNWCLSLPLGFTHYSIISCYEFVYSEGREQQQQICCSGTPQTGEDTQYVSICQFRVGPNYLHFWVLRTEGRYFLIWYIIVKVSHLLVKSPTWYTVGTFEF